MANYAFPPTPAGVDEFAWRAAVSTIRGYCRWHIAPVVTEDVVVEGSGAGHLLLPSLRVVSVNSVQNEGDPVAVEDYEWATRGVIRSVRWGRRWSTKYDQVVVNITHGYEDFPHELLAVARDMARAEGRIGAAGMTSGPHQVQFGVTGAGVQAGAVGMSTLQTNVLDRYRIPGSL